MNKKKKPNILWILSDQYNSKFLGHKGHPDVITPNLDRLASEGVRFDNAITQNPICTPSRVSWISGQYCHNHGYYGLSGPNPNGLPTIFGYFRQNGYTTGAMGKIHCPEKWVEDDCDVFYETCALDERPEYDQYLKEKGLFGQEEHSGYPEFKRQSLDNRVSALTYEDTQEGWLARRAIEFMDTAQNEGKPFLLHVSLPRPHSICAPSEPFWSMYNEEEITLPPNAEYEMKNKAPHLVKTKESWGKGDWALFEPKTFEAARLRKLRGYLGAVSQVDHAVGEMVNWIDKNGIGEDTIIVYSADHGEYVCEQGIMEKSPGICSDAVTRIPCIWRWKGKFKAGHVENNIVETVDFSSTICSLAGIEPLLTSDGKDLTDLLSGNSKEVHKIGVTEFAWSKSVRTGKYRFVYYPEELFREEYPDGFGELYDLETDPWEMNNLFFEVEYKSVIDEIKNDLLNFLITTARPKTILPFFVSSGAQYITRHRNSVNKDGKISPDNIRKTIKGEVIDEYKKIDRYKEAEFAARVYDLRNYI